LQNDNENPRNDDLNLKVKKDIRLNTMLLSELNMGTPFVSAIKKKIDEMRDKLSNQNIKQPGNQIQR
jgi:hypothetical protein